MGLVVPATVLTGVRPESAVVHRERNVGGRRPIPPSVYEIVEKYAVQ